MTALREALARYRRHGIGVAAGRRLHAAIGRIASKAGGGQLTQAQAVRRAQAAFAAARRAS